MVWMGVGLHFTLNGRKMELKINKTKHLHLGLKVNQEVPNIAVSH